MSGNTEPRKVRVEWIGDPLGAIEQIRQEAGHVRVIVRCAACGSIVRRHGLVLFEDQRGAFTCLAHGDLEEPTMRDLHEEWTRRGRPESLSIKRNPLQSTA